LSDVHAFTLGFLAGGQCAAIIAAFLWLRALQAVRP
jgi:hypothetical protein